MEKQFIPYKQALEIKELGFNEECIGYYENNPDKVIFYGGTRTNENWSKIFTVSGKYRLVTPLWQQAFDWFRHKHNLDPQIKSWTERNNIVWYISTEEIGNPSRFKCYEVSVETYEEARFACLDKLIEIIKNK